MKYGPIYAIFFVLVICNLILSMHIIERVRFLPPLFFHCWLAKGFFVGQTRSR